MPDIWSFCDTCDRWFSHSPREAHSRTVLCPVCGEPSTRRVGRAALEDSTAGGLMGPVRETVTLHASRAARIPAGHTLVCQSRGRTCQVLDCQTVLSRYNPSDTCARHAGWRDDPGRRRTD